MSLIKVSLLCASMLAAGSVMAAQKIPSTVAEGVNVSGSQKVTFKNGSLTMAGNLYLPPDYDSARKYPAIVVSHPWGALRSRHPGFTHNSWQSVGLLLWLMMRRIMVKAVGCLVTWRIRPTVYRTSAVLLAILPACRRLIRAALVLSAFVLAEAIRCTKRKTIYA